MSGSKSLSSLSSRISHRSATRWLLLLLTLLAFARLVWRWDTKNLWWDESLSLQRAESPLPALLLGEFTFDDGLTLTTSIDQHPFVYFLALGGLIRVVGDSDFALRLPSAAAATLLVPMSWALARLLERRRVAPRGSALWAGLLVALNPFFLWYGREARMYTLVPLFALLSLYWLLRWTGEAQRPRARRFLVAYIVSLLLLLGTHFLSVLLLPVHALVVFLHLASRNRRRAALAAIAVLVVGLGFGAFAARWVLQGAGSGTNFARVPFLSLATDMLNAFSLGLSVDFARVRWLDYLFGAVAIVGALWAFRPRPTVAREAWLLPAFVIVPVVSLHLIQQFQPAYMNARHMSMISGAFALLVAAGCAAVTQQRRWAGALLGAVLIGGMIYSTVNYFTLPDYAKDNFAQVGADLAAEILPGDAIVLLPAQMVRLYRHYLPIDALEQATLGSDSGSATAPKGWAALPQLDGQWAPTEARLQEMFGKYRRVWLVASGMVPLGRNQDETREWFEKNRFLARDLRYLSNTILELKLYLPQAPVLPEGPGEVEQPVSVVFGDKIRLDGFNIGEPLTDESALPVDLYWQPLGKLDRRYKYILRVVRLAEDGSLTELTRADREPYYGHLPTVWWSPGPEIVEYTGLPGLGRFEGDQSSLRLAVQMYDAETLEKLPVTGIPEGGVLADDQTVLMPFPD